MRILNLEAGHFVELWRRQGHEVLALGRSASDDIVLDKVISLKGLLQLLESREFMPDLVFWADNGRPPSVTGFECLPAVTIGFSIDQYCHPWHVAYSAAFDHFFIAQKDYVHLFEGTGLRREGEWFPLFCDPQKDRDQEIERDIPVSFVGTLDGRFNRRRRVFLERFRQHHALVFRQGRYVDIFNRSRIVLNQSAVGELNFRLFQAAACGAAVLTEAVANGLEELFTPGEDILAYPRDDALEAARLCAQALRDPESLERIASCGKRKVLRMHTLRARGDLVLQRAQEVFQKGVHRFRLSQQSRIRAMLAKAFLFLATDTELPIPNDVRQFYLDLGREYHAESRF